MTASDERLSTPSLQAMTVDLVVHEVGHLIEAANAGVEYVYFYPWRTDSGRTGAIGRYVPDGPPAEWVSTTVMAGVAMTAAADSRITLSAVDALRDPLRAIEHVRHTGTAVHDLAKLDPLPELERVYLFRKTFLTAYAVFQQTSGRSLTWLAHSVIAGTLLPYFDGFRLSRIIAPATAFARTMTAQPHADFGNETYAHAVLTAARALPAMPIANALISRESVPERHIRRMMTGSAD